MGIVVAGILGSVLAAVAMRSRAEARAEEWLSERRKLATVLGGDLGYRHDGEWGMFTLRLPRVSPGPAGEARVGDAGPTAEDRESLGVPGGVVQTS